MTNHRIDPHQRGTRGTRSARLAAGLLVATLIAAGCDDDGASDGELDAELTGEVPAPGGTAFTAGGFDDIQLPAGADEASTRTERDGVISQSFFANAQSPEQIMDFFADSLTQQGWQVAEPVSQRGTDSLAGAWTADGRRLEVSALLAQGVENERTQFSVVLLPATVPGEEVNTD